MKLKINLKFLKRESLVLISLFFITIITFSIIQKNIENSNAFYHENEISEYKYRIEKPETASVWALVNLTNNSEMNNTCNYHNTTIPIDGELLDGALIGIPGYIMVILIDGKNYNEFNATTKANGKFIINLTIPYSLNIYSSHKIEADVVSPAGTVIFLNHYTINVNATSYFDIDNHNQNNPQLAGGFYKIPGFLRYDNSSGIPNQIIKSTWKNETHDYLETNSPFNTSSVGSFKYIPIPDDNVSKILFLNLTYNGNSPYINGTQELISIKLYRNITCIWNTVGSADEEDTITIRGQLIARNNSNLVINFTDVRITRNYATIANITTDSNGNFAYSFTFPTGSAGNNIFGVEIANFSNIFSNTSHIISIASAPIIPAEDIGDDDEDTPPPFQNFFIVFIPIIIGIAAVLIVFIYIHLRKQKAESLVVKLPLEDRIRNLKILKDTERVEEALSYLFQSIYIELINAKFNVRKKENETIRDFAIISVRDLKLNPASIYPFIQNVEQVIYDKPYIIDEVDFYKAVELFSPIYFELTGYHFILNF